MSLKTMAPHRLPLSKHFKAAHQTAVNKSRLDKSPLVALDIIHERSPESFILSVQSA